MRITCLLAALLWLTLTPARADFTVGLSAYDGGDYGTAVQQWLPLAQAGDPDAQIALAGLYMQGFGVARDPAIAVQWYRRAAQQGAAMAQLNLGDLYRRGVGVMRDLVTAYAWLHLAAESGQPWAQKQRASLNSQLTQAQITTALTLAPRLSSMR